VFYNEAITVYPDSDVAKVAREKLVDVNAKLDAQAAAAAGQPAPRRPSRRRKRSSGCSKGTSPPVICHSERSEESSMTPHSLDSSLRSE